MNWLRLFSSVFFFRFPCLFLWLSFTLAALDPGRSITQYSMHIWNRESGLPGNTVLALQQTRDGFLWIGTQNGLVRFDGLRFELYNTKKIPQLKSNLIRALYEDRNGTLWIGTSSGGLTYYKKGQFTTYPVTGHSALNRISAVNEDRRGTLWIGSLTGGLTCLNKGKFTTYTTAHGLPHNQVRFIYKDGKGDLWVTTSAGIVKLMEPGVFQVYAAREDLPYIKTACLYDGDSGELWIGTGDSGLSRLKSGIFTSYGTKEGIPHPTITCLYKDRDKNLWIGTDGGGLTRMKDGKFSTLHGGGGLACGFVYSIYEDREGSLWVGTVEGGLHRLKVGKFTTFTTREGLAHDYIECIHEGRTGHPWIGTKGGLNRLKEGRVTTVLTTRQGLLDNTVLSLFEDPGGCLWIGTWKGLHRFKDGKLTTLTKKHGLSGNRVRCILGDSRGNTWVGTENGLNRFNEKNGKFTVFTKKGGLSSNFIRVLFEDSRGNLLIGTDAGLHTFRDGIITVLNPGEDLDNNIIRCVYEDGEGVLWIGTESGLMRRQDNKTTRYTVPCGLAEDYVYTVLEDERGFLWLGGRNGISRIEKKQLHDFATGKIDHIHPHIYNEMDGMKSAWCSGNGCKTGDGRFWFSTGVGVAVIDPNHIKENKLPPPVIIEKLIADGEIIKSFSGGPNRRGRFYKKAPLVLTPGKKRLEFYYTGVSFSDPQKMRFKLKLTGYDSDWIDMGSARSTTYTRLPPGQYTFNVIAANPDGVWNREGASISFYLKPYFSQTRWFYLLAGSFVLLAAFSIYRFRVRQLRTREKELGSLVDARTRDLKERTVELETAHHKLLQSKKIIEAKNIQLEGQSKKLKELDNVKSRFFANISHEFRTPLTLIMGPLEEKLADCRDKQEKKELKMMLRNSRRLLSLINQLLDLSKIDGGKMTLQAARQNIVPFLKGIVNSFDSLALQNELKLTFYTPAEDIVLCFDTRKIEDAILNLLINAVKFTPPGGEISVTLNPVREPAPGFLEISVRDTGIGIPVERLDHIFDRFYQAEGLASHNHRGSGIGLALANEVIKLHHGEITVHSEKGKGSEFIIRLPLGDSQPGVRADEPGVRADEPGVRADAKPRDILGIPPAEEEEGEDAVETAAAGPTGKNIILLVEDNADVRAYIRGPLQALYRVVEAKNGAEGIKKAREIIPDLIISDVMMPGIDGYELCRALKNDIKTSHIPIVHLTAKASEESILEGLGTGADDYITKPFNTRILMARIKNLIDLRRQLHETIKQEMTLQPAKMTISEIDKEFMKDLKKVIEANLSDPDFNVDRLCKKLYMSGATLYRKILALTAETPTDFIRSYRLKRAVQLLKSGFGSITEVAFEVGFNSRAYFTRCFKEKFHKLPSEVYAAGDRRVEG